MRTISIPPPSAKDDDLFSDADDDGADWKAPHVPVASHLTHPVA